MLRFLEQDGYTLVVPGRDDESWLAKTIAEGRKTNEDTLASFEKSPSGGKLTGSFIYSHPPDYIGRPTMTWDTVEWRSLFGELKEMGIDTVIYQAAAWAEVRECN